MNTKDHLAALIVAALAISHNSANANIFEDIADEGERFVNRASAEINRIPGNVQDMANNAGRELNRGLNQVQSVHAMVTSVPRSVIADNLGNDWVRAFDVLNSAHSIQQEMSYTAGRYLGNCLQGQCNINQIAAMPLAAALRDAYKRNQGNCRPFANNILYANFDNTVVSRACWVVNSTPDFTVPGFLNAGYNANGEAHAVTIGNIVIFSRAPDLNDPSDVQWVFHELQHVRQYMNYSSNWLEAIDGFAVDYINHYNSMERDADNVSYQAMQYAANNGWFDTYYR